VDPPLIAAVHNECLSMGGDQQAVNVSRSTWSVLRLVALMKPSNCSSLMTRMNLALNSDSRQRITNSHNADKSKVK